MSYPLLIGISGQRGSGKDSAAQFIIEWAARQGLSAVRKSFADKLKHSAMTSLGFVVTESDALVLANDLKEIGEITTCIPDQGVLYTISGRKFLQLFGTEAHKDIFDQMFWVNALISSDNWRENFDRADICIIADVRFEEEAERIQELGGLVVEVRRPGLPKDEHRSEKGIPARMVDHVVMNDRDLESLQQEVVKMMDQIDTDGVNE